MKISKRSKGSSPQTSRPRSGGTHGSATEKQDPDAAASESKCNPWNPSQVYPRRFDPSLHRTTFVTSKSAADLFRIGDKTLRDLACAEGSKIRRVWTAWGALLFSLDDLRTWRRMTKTDLERAVQKQLPNATPDDVREALGESADASIKYSLEDADRVVNRLREKLAPPPGPDSAALRYASDPMSLMSLVTAGKPPSAPAGIQENSGKNIGRKHKQ